MSEEVKSACCYCGVGCGVLIEVDGEAGNRRITGVRGDPDHPANFGRLCTKGATLHLTARHDTRLLTPQLRRDRCSALQTVGWDEALDEAAQRFAACIREHGPDSVAFYISGQLLTEDYYVFNKLAKGLIGTNNVDTNSRLCMSSAVAGYKQTLGVDAPPCSYEDIGLADCLLIAGANPAVAHPIVFRRIEDARAANPALKIIVIDPRRSETAEIADLHLALRPGTDVALFNGLLHVLLAENLVDRKFIAAHTEGFAALEKTVSNYAPAMVAHITGVPVADILQAARWFAQGPRALSLYCQGLNQSSSGTHKNVALIHLHLATGQIGKAGAGPFSLTGQPNAMGGREVGGMANLLSAHRDLANPAHRAEVASLWGIPDVPATPGKTAVELFDAVKRGEIKAVWIACTNPAQSMPSQAVLREALQAAEFVVLQDAFSGTDTAAFADLMLPATTWGEKEGTVTNSERRITHVRAAVPAPGEARADWAIAVDFARRLGAQLGRDTASLFPYQSVEEVFNEHRESTRGRDLDITGMSYSLLDALGPLQWPMPEGDVSGQTRLYENHVFPTASGRARFVDVLYRPVAEEVDADYPLSLISGRMRDHWHGMSRTGTVARLFNLEDEPCVLLHPADMSRYGLHDGDLACLRSRRGSIVLRAMVSTQMLPGSAWMPMHWGSRFMNSAGVNTLTIERTDPFSHQPELKHAAVAIERVNLPWQLVVLRKRDAGRSELDWLAAARVLLSRFDYASAGLYGRDTPLVVFRAALAAAPDDALLDEVDSVFGFDEDASAIDYIDRQRRINKRAVLESGRLAGVRLAGETQAQAWLKDAMSNDTLDSALVHWALAPIDKPPVRLPERGRIVCKCADVSENEIEKAMGECAGLAELQNKLKCGTFCGACLPEIRQQMAQQPQSEAA